MIRRSRAAESGLRLANLPYDLWLTPLYAADSALNPLVAHAAGRRSSKRACRAAKIVQRMLFASRRSGLPTIFGYREHVVEGALI